VHGVSVMSIRDEIRDLMARYPADPERTRAALDAALAPEPTAAEQAASVLGDLGFTAEDVLDALAADGTITVLPLGDISEERVMDLARFTGDDRAAFRGALAIPAGAYTPAQVRLLERYEKARNELMYGKEDWR
jgi:hypothetical protein